MNINRLSLLLLLIVATYFPSSAQKLNSDELAEILGIESWRVPMPKDEKFEWDVSIVDYAPRDFGSINAAEFSPQQEVLVALREAGKDTYAYTVKNNRTVTRSGFKIDVCTEKEKKDNVCENVYRIKWYSEAKSYGNGRRFVIADIIKKGSPRKQVVLRLNRLLPNGLIVYP